MYALVDCNSFFCSVEKAFHPGLDGKPVCVLSNNDGCIVALTPEAKSLGLRRGDPLFKVSSVVKANNVVVFSTNMMLYAAMSKRVTAILRKSIAHVESYSIDECFCSLDGYGRMYDMEQLMRSVADKIKLWTDIPVSVGIAPSKTLAKVASKYAKQYKGYRSVCTIDNDTKRRKALAMLPLSDIWGIGRSTLADLEYHGVKSALDFADKNERWVRSRFKLPVLRTWKELNGCPCIDTSEVKARQTICTSRSFGKTTASMQQMKEAVAAFTANCANKLRGQQSVAGSITVFIQSDRFRTDLAQYGNSLTQRMPVKTSDTLELTQAALKLLANMYVPGIMYKKAGVVLGDIADSSSVIPDLFDNVRNRGERAGLMQALDNINRRYGSNTMRLALEGISPQPWHVKCEHRSGNYLTDINEILTINI